MLQLDAAQRAYRLAPAVLSLAHAMRSGSNVLAIAAPKMRALAERARINVGLAAPDRDEMVYLESIRYARRHAFRNVVSGQRVPMELTSLGSPAPLVGARDDGRISLEHVVAPHAVAPAAIARATRDDVVLPSAALMNEPASTNLCRSMPVW
jgi:hypothetical protein